MQRLKDAGLNSLPGGGGEILDDEVRARVSTKCNTQEWLDVMRAVHKVGLRSTATMMFGIGDRIEHRVRHLAADPRCAGRDAADLRPSFRGHFNAKTPLSAARSPKNRPASIIFKCSPSRGCFLDNVQHIQASWLTQGLKLGQTALRFGADDMGSIMIEENVVSAAGASHLRQRSATSATRSAKPDSYLSSATSSTITSTATASTTSTRAIR